MKSYLCLLRGINVSGKNIIKMAELSELMRQEGLQAVKTYIQSGNIVFKSEIAKADILEEKISSAIKLKFGYEVPALVVDYQSFSTIVALNPFVGELDIKNLHVTILKETPKPELLNTIPNTIGDDSFQIIGCAIYLNCPNGYGNTKLTNTFFEKKLKQKATTRNWKTCLELLKMLKNI
jgi:uncharacterized protein (DUF1697 family)